MGLYSRLSSPLRRKKHSVGIGREIMEPNHVSVISHLEERRGSRLRPDDGQYLEGVRNSNSLRLQTYTLTSSGHAANIFKASSCCLASSVGFKFFKRCPIMRL